MRPNLEHLTALLVLGTGAIILTLEQQIQAALFLFGVLAGYAFKNGVLTNYVHTQAVAESSDTGQTNQKQSAVT